MTITHLNVVTRDAVEIELSDAEMYRLAYLAYRVTSLHIPTIKDFIESVRTQLLDRMRFRSAPSIVVRSEAELFGINMPRFAYRAIFAEGTEQASFVNLRRIESFVTNVARRLEMGPRDEFISQLRQKCRCVADSFLAVPAWAEDYHVITTDLAKWYSEKGPATGTPFVTHFPVGGGMCAQAVCFMVSALLHDDAEGVYGVSEVTMLSTPGDEAEQKFLNFSGLTIDRMKTYFKKIGLFGQPQRPKKSDNQKSALRDYKSALRAYLLSGIPVIIPVDICKLRKTVYKQLPLSSHNSRADETEIQRHVVLAVGVRKDENNDGVEEFLIHDPATYPFIQARAEDLFEAGKNVGNRQEGPMLFPVAASPVPALLQVTSEPSGGAEMSNLLDNSLKTGKVSGRGDIRYHWCRTSQVLGGTRHQFFAANFEWTLLLDCLATYAFDEAWLQIPTQFFDSAVVTVWVEWEDRLEAVAFYWNKQSESWEPQKEALANSFRKTQNPRPETSSKIEGSEQGVVEESHSDADNQEGQQLIASMMTSFSLKGAVDLIQTLHAIGWKGPLEQYVWMQSDVDKVIETHVGGNLVHKPVRDLLNLNAVDALALLSPRKLLLDRIVEFYNRLTHPTVAIATFIPELSADPESERGQLARLAIVTLGWLAVCINQNQSSSPGNESEQRPPVRRIELVGGSRIGRVYQCMPSGRSRIELIAEVLSSNVALHNIADNLRLAMESDNALVTKMRMSGLAFALEQEPGPLFTLGSMHSLRHFCTSFLDEPQYALLKNVVGLNADVSHWSMSAQVPGPFEAVKHRIVHAHISGHHPTSHFGDTELTEDMAKRYRTLLQLLRSLLSREEIDKRKKEGWPQYSGYISLEYEAAPNLAAVKKSIECLQQILRS